MSLAEIQEAVKDLNREELAKLASYIPARSMRIPGNGRRGDLVHSAETNFPFRLKSFEGVDPWWNPAVEAQATDRAHRIGQTRVVTACKLITRDTVDERILRLQEKKRAPIDAAIDSEEPMMTGLTTEEVEELLA